MSWARSRSASWRDERWPASIHGRPAVGGSMLAVWLVSAVIWRMSSLAALIAVGTLPLWVWLFRPQASLGVFAAAIIILIIYAHRDNIGRIRAGTESKFGRRTPVNEAAADRRV